MSRKNESRIRSLARFVVVCAVTLTLGACGDDTDTLEASDDAGTNNLTQADAGMESDSGSSVDAGPLECPEDQFPVEGECTRGGLDIIIGGFNTEARYAFGLASFFADPGPALERIEVTETCSYAIQTASGPAPTGPDCYDAGTLTVRHDGGEFSVEQGADCYQSQFENVEIAGQTITFSFAGGADFSAVDIELDVAEPAELEMAPVDGGTRVTRVNAEETTSYGYLLTASDGPTIFCEETAAGELLLTAADIAAIQEVEGEHSDAIVFHSANQNAVEDGLYINAVSQLDAPLVGIIPSE